MLHVLQWLYTYVASFCSQCFLCFSQTYIASVFIIPHIYCKYLSGCCVCFIMLFKCFSSIFISVLDAYFKFSSAFRRMLQVLRLDVSKVDQMFIFFCNVIITIFYKYMLNGRLACLRATIVST
jgi:hypothetical protein